METRFNNETGRFENWIGADELSNAINCAIGYMRNGMSERMAIFHTCAGHEDPATLSAALAPQLELLSVPDFFEEPSDDELAKAYPAETAGLSK